MGDRSYVDVVSAGECRVDGPCQQMCFDLHDGTFECGCTPGYRLSSNGYSCQLSAQLTFSLGVAALVLDLDLDEALLRLVCDLDLERLREAGPVDVVERSGGKSCAGG
ncbi:hypothetical protein HPB50_016078 [Hyalomma asiaticum]|uniref:Uncharacterized protein n=1 Tax=Hyalomma asiaticum TaxID=266040 RepID=A0ACB7T2Y9_HYAAI|nr:hypothetical protein HPB50_016078 [Hyalomma asiaticum]